MDMSLFQVMQKTKNIITPTPQPCFNQATEQYDRRLSYEQDPREFKIFTDRNNILIGLSPQINRITPTIVFINLISHNWLNKIVIYSFIMWFYYMDLYLTEIKKLTPP